MSTWWDEDKRRYRSTLTHKVFYVWGWPVLRWIMFNTMKPQQAHYLAIHFGIPCIHYIDLLVQKIMLVLAFLAILGLFLLSFLPGFHWKEVKSMCYWWRTVKGEWRIRTLIRVNGRMVCVSVELIGYDAL